MRFAGFGAAVALAALLAACATSQPLQENRGGIALRIQDDEDALEDAIERAGAHCGEYGRFAVLQAVSEPQADERLVTFNCAESQGRGVALGFRDGEDLDDVTERAEERCDRYGREAVLQSVSTIGDSRVAAFACA